MAGLVVAMLLQAKPAAPPEEWRGWRDGVWVKIRLAGNG